MQKPMPVGPKPYALALPGLLNYASFLSGTTAHNIDSHHLLFPTIPIERLLLFSSTSP
jgi:hypothetical protein